MNLKAIFGPSLDERLIAVKGYPSGFDYMRPILATMIIFFHSFEISYGIMPREEIFNHPIRPLTAAVMPMFFAISGFLVSSSLDRAKSLLAFIGLRILRILPALAVEVTLAALILGPLLTVVPLKTYFTSAMFFDYFRNIIGDIHYLLPGVFWNNPVPATVNAQLWALPYELKAYFALLFIAITGIYQRRWLWLAIVSGYYLLCGYLVLFGADGYRFHFLAWTVIGNTLMLCAFWGVVIYQYRDMIPWNPILAIVCAGVSWIFFAHPDYDMFAALPVSYVGIYLGLYNPPRDKIILSGDYSYGLFLYGFPIQQAIASFGPAFHHWYINSALGFSAALALAVASWWFIEKPALSLRKYLYKRD